MTNTDPTYTDPTNTGPTNSGQPDVTEPSSSAAGDNTGPITMDELLALRPTTSWLQVLEGRRIVAAQPLPADSPADPANPAAALAPTPVHSLPAPPPPAPPAAGVDAAQVQQMVNDAVTAAMEQLAGFLDARLGAAAAPPAHSADVPPQSPPAG